MNRQIVQLADGIGQKIVLIGVEKPEGSSKTLRNFMQKHPYIPSANRNPAPVSCEQCFADSGIIYPAVPCNCDERKLFQIVIKTQKNRI